MVVTSAYYNVAYISETAGAWDELFVLIVIHLNIYYFYGNVIIGKKTNIWGQASYHTTSLFIEDF